MNKESKVVIVDNHKLYCEGVSRCVDHIEGHRTLFLAYSGKELLEKMQSEKEIPDIILMDVHMSPINGIEATKRITKEHPSIKVIALSAFNDEYNIMAMFHAGAKSYISKNTDIEELKTAFKSIAASGYYFSDLLTEALQDQKDGIPKHISFSRRELEFMKHCVHDITYKEISTLMCVSERTLDDYRDNLLKKLNVKSKVGIAVFAITRGIANIN